MKIKKLNMDDVTCPICQIGLEREGDEVNCPKCGYGSPIILVKHRGNSVVTGGK